MACHAAQNEEKCWGGCAGAENSSFFGGPAVKVARGALSREHRRTCELGGRWESPRASSSRVPRPPILLPILLPIRPSRPEWRSPRATGANRLAGWPTLFCRPVRSMVDLVFLTTGTAGFLLQNEQIVPRTKDFFFTSNGQIGLFPTLFVETGTSPNVGARMIASIDPFAATLRAGYGGSDENVVEGRMRLSLSLGVPAVMSLEGLHDRRSGLGFLGLGQTPESDPRNQFRNGPAAGVFRERRERVVAGFGLRPLADLELLLSSSLTQRYIDDPADPDLAPPSTRPSFRARSQEPFIRRASSTPSSRFEPIRA